MQFAGKVVLVTGAQHGIGRAMALEFAAIGINLKGSCAAHRSLTVRHAQARACARGASIPEVLWGHTSS